MSRKCEYCGEYFSTSRSLKLHQKSAQYCLQIQRNKGLKPEYEEHRCDCGHIFSLRGNLVQHRKKCKFITEKEESKQTVIINNGTVNINTNNTINNTTNNILIDVHPFTVDKLTSEYIVSKLTPVITKEVMKAGINPITELIIELLLKNDGKYCYWCTDKSRKQFKMLINSDGEVSVKDDPNAFSLRTIISFPLKLITLPFAADTTVGKSTLETYNEIQNIKLQGSSFMTALASALPKTPDGIDSQIIARAELEASDPEKLKQIAKLEKQLEVNKRRRRMAEMGIFDDDL